MCILAGMPSPAGAAPPPPVTTPTTPPPGTVVPKPQPTRTWKRCHAIKGMRAIKYTGFPASFTCRTVMHVPQAWLRFRDREDDYGLNMDVLLRYWSCGSDMVNYRSYGNALGWRVDCSSSTDTNGHRARYREVRFIVRAQPR